MKLFYQSILLLLSFGLVYGWEQTPFNAYTIQILGFLIFLYIIISAKKGGLKGGGFAPKGESWTIFILNTIILLFIVSTGGFTSSLFFLLYFVAFGIAFVFEPATVFIFVIGTVLFFIQDALKDDVTRNFIMLGSLALISPLAYFFGKEYRQDEKQEEAMQNVSENIKKDVGEILDEDNLNSKEREKLEEVIKETEKLK